MTTKWSLHVSAELKNLAAVRDFVEASAAALRVDPDDTLDVIQSIDELACNIIVHGYQGRAGTIEIEVEHDHEALIVRLRDQAPVFDPTQAPMPDVNLPLDERPIGGMGIYLVRHMMDAFTHRVTPQGGNEVTVVKKTTWTRGDNS
jgi:serine/threonine-protein kinase RsbW